MLSEALHEEKQGYELQVKETGGSAANIRLLSLSQDEMDRICNTFDGYVQMTVPAGTYEGIPEVQTLGVKAVLLVSQEVSDAAVYQMCKALFANIDSFEEQPGLRSDITLKSASEGIMIPFHAGSSMGGSLGNALIKK
ncbi:TAXI family TRAP transporter solute-binding subunit [Lactimicrobium massiliense]|uniref:TAXI family TRAP transporter solute-binding subunit n=1 Tax=Lactimicrobium massiliense TaxID=2161814 RepID=UPI000D559260|nr:TAXI family TRAP transporter solute-binding subunit [Lactimicrobium massiliense]